MKQVPIEELVEAVRVTLDENQVESEYLATGTDNMELDEIIRAKLVYAVRSILEMCPVGLMEAEEMDLPDVAQLPADDGSGSIVLPEDFLRLVSFKLKSWNRAVTTVADEGSPTDLMQRNPFTRGTWIKPVCVFSHNSEGQRTMEYFTAGKDADGKADHRIERALYVPLPAVQSGDDGDTLGIPALLRSSIIYYCAGLVEITRGNPEAGDHFIKIATSNFNPL